MQIHSNNVFYLNAIGYYSFVLLENLKHHKTNLLNKLSVYFVNIYLLSIVFCVNSGYVYFLCQNSHYKYIGCGMPIKSTE